MGPNAFKLRFYRSEMEDRNPTPGAICVRAGFASFTMTATMPRGTVSPPTYPNPPSTGLKRSPDVESMFHRCVGYREGREPLTTMAYFCLTVLEASTGERSDRRATAAKRFCISEAVLKQLGALRLNQRRCRRQKGGRRPPRLDSAGKKVPGSGRHDFHPQGGRGGSRSGRVSQTNHGARLAPYVGETVISPKLAQLFGNPPMRLCSKWCICRID